jgi:hypothetical protein
MPEQNRELKNRVREIRSHGSVRGQGRNGLALLGNICPPAHCIWWVENNDGEMKGKVRDDVLSG